MPTETELKLRITPVDLKRLKRHPVIRKYSTGRPLVSRLHNIYYDTAKQDLHKSKIALRLRRQGRQWTQTIKGGGSVEAGLHHREEWEVPVDGPVLDFSLSEFKMWEERLPKSIRKRLQPVFVTDFSRSARMLQLQGAEIELCIDQGEVITQEHSLSLCEIELELKSGDPLQLFTLASEILDIVPFELEEVSKAEKGYRLLAGYEEHPVRSVLEDINRNDPLFVVLKAQIWSCLQHLQANLGGAMQSEDSEYLHQLRVALRRLRVVLSMTEKYRASKQLADLSKEVAELCFTLGAIREWDVFISQTVWPMSQRMADNPGMQTMLKVCMQHRETSYAVLREQSQVCRFQRLLLRFSIWMNGEYWQGTENNLLAVVFARKRLNKLSRHFAEAGKEISSLDHARLHELRILAKKLRYTAEFFASLWDKNTARVYLSSLSDVQDILGNINDIAVAHRLLDELGDERDLNNHLEALTLARGWIEHDLSEHLAGLHKVMRKFFRKRGFWLAK